MYFIVTQPALLLSYGYRPYSLCHLSFSLTSALSHYSAVFLPGLAQFWSSSYDLPVLAISPVPVWHKELPTFYLLCHAHGIPMFVVSSWCLQAGVILITYLCISVLFECGTPLHMSSIRRECSQVLACCPLGLWHSKIKVEDAQSGASQPPLLPRPGPRLPEPTTSQFPLWLCQLLWHSDCIISVDSRMWQTS